MHNAGDVEIVGMLVGLVIFVVAAAIYFLPTIVVLNNKYHNNKPGVVIINLVFGWSFVGWIIALIWACHKNIPPQVQVSVNANHYAPPQPVPVASVPFYGQPEIPPQSRPQIQPPSPALSYVPDWRGYLYQNGTLVREFSVSSRPMVIGRSFGVDIQVDDSHVSGRHWQVQATANGVELKDLNSTNGTWKHGKTRTEWDLAGEGDWYQVGGVQIGFRQN